jgi:hypothetical protein
MNKSKLAYLPECPFKALTTQVSQSKANIVIQHCKLPLYVEIRVKDENNNDFDNFTSTKDRIEWSIDAKNLLLVQKDNKIEIANKIVYYKTFETQNLIGEVNVEAKFKHLNAKLFVKLILTN